MKLVKPYAKLLTNNDNKEHIVKCAQICYASEKLPIDIDDWLEQKWYNGHKSIFRHGTYYYAIPVTVCTEQMRNFFKNNPYVGYYENNEFVFVSVNGQTYRETPWLGHLFKYTTTELGLMGLATHVDDLKEIENIIRKTVCVQTQISTSRELNRTSPNNICEQSTRYCNFSKDKFNGEVSICEPHWLSIIPTDETECFITINDNNTVINVYDLKSKLIDTINYDTFKGVVDDKYINYIFNYLCNIESICKNYNYAVNNGIPVQDARGMLPLDTATKVVYTYRIEEWQNILNLRYYGTAGKPHPNARIIANLIRVALNNGIVHNKFPNINSMNK